MSNENIQLTTTTPSLISPNRVPTTLLSRGERRVKLFKIENTTVG